MLWVTRVATLRVHMAQVTDNSSLITRSTGTGVGQGSSVTRNLSFLNHARNANAHRHRLWGLREHGSLPIRGPANRCAKMTDSRLQTPPGRSLGALGTRASSGATRCA